MLTKEGEEFVENNANLFKYDLLYNPLRFESWKGLANIYDEVKIKVLFFSCMNSQKLKVAYLPRSEESMLLGTGSGFVIE